jgi:NAD(P)-dependent dehydrogenase (short-subunit alcohol dehydrogenase family)
MPRSISEQVIVITGASSGIGLVTAQAAARRGARVVLAAHTDPEVPPLPPHALMTLGLLGGHVVYGALVGWLYTVPGT